MMVGVIIGFGAIGFHWLVTACTQMVTGYADFCELGRVPSPHWPALKWGFLLLAPVVTGAIYGPIVHRFAPETRGHGVPEVMYAVHHRGGRIAPQITLIKALASALCIGGGGSVGREGPIVQIGSAAGSAVGQYLRLDAGRIRLLVGCGAAGAIAATFNAPLAGPIFALELILRDFTAESFIVVLLASIPATVVSRAILGNAPTLPVTSTGAPGHTDYLLFGVLGVITGILAVAFSKTLYLTEDVCDWAWRGPEWARPAVGGVFLGGLLLLLPQMYGVGYPILQHAIHGQYLIATLILLMVGKILATSLTIGIGGSGGIFAPTLFIGAMAGTTFGLIAHDLLPRLSATPGIYGLVGMAAALSAATGGPITAVIIVVELTGQYSLTLPLMTAVAVAAGTAHLLSDTTIYTAKLVRRALPTAQRQ